MINKLQVKYESESLTIDEDFDSKIIKFVQNELGYKWYAQGYDFKSKERDINFEKK